MTDPVSIEQLAPWVADQRWYASKGKLPTLEVKGLWRLSADDAEILVYLFIDRAGALPVLYQVPLTVRRDAEPTLAGALVQTSEGGFVYDGPHDPAFARALLSMITEQSASDEVGSIGGARAFGHLQPGAAVGEVVSARVLSGEQSNTSIIYETLGADGAPGTPVICKVFRALHNGDNPDVTVQSALNAAGSLLVPPVVGNVTGEWDDSGEESGRAHGHLAFAQEFLPGVRDAWRVALDAVGSGHDFSAEARALGIATAEVHATLASVMETEDATPETVARIVATMRRRHAIAVREVPEIAENSEAIERVYAAAATAVWPQLQRIHGDYHLGQVLAVPDRGWVLLDFEGEPLRPMNERRMPDLILRDVAGMLRSFDYAAGAQMQAHPGTDASAWASAARRSFVDGYIESSGYDLRAHRPVLDAFEIDKAIYEAIYEARNRPAWLSIPIAAIARLAHRQPLDPLSDFSVPEDADLHVDPPA
ncbi:phosphotransferase [Microbacteriaceae bacterium VKM Ac-2854]|nr:phosphotransferase [Microbacteriaceae bacterium VKM Ac-2854]